jgi:hypothetical protein
MFGMQPSVSNVPFEEQRDVGKVLQLPMIKEPLKIGEVLLTNLRQG